MKGAETGHRPLSHTTQSAKNMFPKNVPVKSRRGSDADKSSKMNKIGGVADAENYAHSCYSGIEEI